MNRIALGMVPFGLAFLLAGCGPGEVGDDCKEDADCDTENGLICDLGDETGDDAEGVCAEKQADPTEE